MKSSKAEREGVCRISQSGHSSLSLESAKLRAVGMVADLEISEVECKLADGPNRVRLCWNGRETYLDVREDGMCVGGVCRPKHTASLSFLAEWQTSFSHSVLLATI